MTCSFPDLRRSGNFYLENQGRWVFHAGRGIEFIQFACTPLHGVRRLDLFFAPVHSRFVLATCRQFNHPFCIWIFVRIFFTLDFNRSLLSSFFSVAFEVDEGEERRMHLAGLFYGNHRQLETLLLRLQQRRISMHPWELREWEVL